jgi:hypothetical protein
LQFLPGMKRLAVGILAVMTLAGCGVGYDDPEGQAAAGVSAYGTATQGLIQADSTVPAAPAKSVAGEHTAQTGATSETTGLAVPGTRALPQDPVPLMPRGGFPGQNVGPLPGQGETVTGR